MSTVTLNPESDEVVLPPPAFPAAASLETALHGRRSAREFRADALPPQRGDGLLVVDVQRDFLPGGALAVAHGDRILPPLQRLLARFASLGLPVFASRDWHPPGHCSFESGGGHWPTHCVAGSPGALFAKGLALPAATVIVSKAQTQAADAYSAFDGTPLAAAVRKAGVNHLLVAGLATDYCVLHSVLDALGLGHRVTVVSDAIAAVELRPGDGARALAAMRARGADVVHSARLLARTTAPDQASRASTSRASACRPAEKSTS